MRVRILLTFICLTTISASASSQDIQQALKQECEGKILVLRHPLQKNTQEYGADGAAVNPGAEGPWTLYGRVAIDQVELSASALMINAHRVDYKVDRSQGHLAPFPNKTKVKINIFLHQLPTNLQEAKEALGRVFAFTRKDVVDSAPEFWRSYLEGHVAPIPTKAPAASQSQVENKQDVPGSGVAISEQEAIKLYVIGRDVQPPQAIFTPEPTFPDKASTENYQGVVILNMVVDATGRVQNIHVIRAMGMGMEEAAVSVVEKKWRLKPAQRDKKPVAVEMNIEVAFNKF